MGETRRLVAHCHAIGREPLPAAVARHARLLLLDYLGVAAAGATLEESSRVARSIAAEMGGTPEATSFGLSDRLPAPMAAFVNGVAGHGIEMDDTHSAASSHPGVVIWSAALAAAEREGAPGWALLAAAAAGYEMACRVGYAGAPPSLYARGFHPTSVSGVFGAAAAAGCLMGLTGDQMLHAAGIAGSFAAGNMEYLAQGTWTKRLQPGQAAHAGVLSVLLARRGYTGPATILEGRFGALHAYSDAAVRGRLTEGLGKTREILRTGIKAFGCCRYMQSPMEAALKAVRGREWRAEDVVAIRVGLVSAGWGLVAEPIEQKHEPKTRVDAQFSVPFGVATALHHGRATVREFREEQLRNRTILDLARKVAIHHDEALDRAYPALWPSWCEIDMRDGRRLRGDVRTTKGEPENPMTPEEVREKFDGLAAPYWSAAEARAVAERVDRMDRESVRGLMDLVRRGGAGGAKSAAPPRRAAAGGARRVAHARK